MTAPVAVILNPHSGVGHRRDSLEPLLLENGIEANIVVAVKGCDLTSMASELYRSGYRTVVAAGGDGTVNGVAAAIVDTEGTLGIIPAGTLNHFAKDLKLPLDLEGSVRNLRTGTVQSVDVAEVNGRIFLNNSGLGLYPAMVAQREKRQRSGQRKWIAFAGALLATFRRFPFLYVRLEAQGHSVERRTPFVFVGNNLYRMEGIDLGSRDSLTEGRLCLGVAQYRIGRWGLVRLALRALFVGIRGERYFEVLITEEVQIASRHRRLAVSLDGEVALLEAPLQYRTRPHALRVIAPERA